MNGDINTNNKEMKEKNVSHVVIHGSLQTGRTQTEADRYYAKQREKKKRNMNWEKQTAAAAAQKSNNKTNNSLTVPRVQAMQKDGSRG